jgi:hypothetical protein
MLLIDILAPLAEIDDLDSQQSHDVFAEYQNALGVLFKIKVDGGLAGIMFDNHQEWKDMSRRERFDKIHEYHSEQYQECLHLKEKD